IWALDAIDGGSAARRSLLRAAGDPDERVRRQAIRQLGMRRVGEEVGPLCAALGGTNLAVRFQAATALGRIGDRGAIPALRVLLADTNLFTHFAAFMALNRIGRADPKSWEAIVKGLESSNPAIHEGSRF